LDFQTESSDELDANPQAAGAEFHQFFYDANSYDVIDRDEATTVTKGNKAPNPTSARKKLEYERRAEYLKKDRARMENRAPEGYDDCSSPRQEQNQQAEAATDRFAMAESRKRALPVTSKRGK
jgi:hypothetical protein